MPTPTQCLVQTTEKIAEATITSMAEATITQTAEAMVVEATAEEVTTTITLQVPTQTQFLVPTTETTEEVNITITITITVVVTIMETAEATITTEVTITVVGSHRRGMPFQLIIPSWHVIQIPTIATMASPFTIIQLLYKRNEISTLFKQCPRSAKYLSGKSG
jgi:hypothetical protein